MRRTLLVNGRFYTLGAPGNKVEAVYVENGRIMDTGSVLTLKNKYAGQNVRLLDLQGYTVFPGFTDSHMHLLSYGLQLSTLDFSDCRTVFEIKQRLQAKIASTPPGKWITGFGWNENLFAEGDMLLRQELDELSAEHPIFLTRICGHAHVVNTLTLRKAGLDEYASDPPGGKFERDESGRLSGIVLERAVEPVQRVVPNKTYAELKEALRLAVQNCWQNGLVGCHTEDVREGRGFFRTLCLYDEVTNSKVQPFRAHLLTHHDYLDDMLRSDLPSKMNSPYFTLGAVKIFADGALGGRSALLSKPYADDPGNHGVAIHSGAELVRIVERARAASLPVAVHTIGDLALEMTLDALEAVPHHGTELPDRIIHAQVLRPELMERMQKLPIIVDIQPRFVASDFPWVIDRLGKERIPLSYAWKSLLNAGIHCAGGSDAPIEPVSPLLGIHAAITRRHPQEEEHVGYEPEQRLTVTEAVHLFTTGSALAEGALATKGTIERGKAADFTVLDQDLYEVGTDQILNTRVVMTIVGGQVVFSA